VPRLHHPEEQQSGECSHSDLLAVFAARRLKPRVGQDPGAWLRSLTHLQLSNAGLCGTLSESLCTATPKASVAYLYANQLANVRALSRLAAITMLHLEVRHNRCH
jgi:hypothetical protein